MNIFNQYSFIWLAVFLLVIVGTILLRRQPKWPQVLTFAALLISLTLAWMILHPRQTAQVEEAAQVQARIGQGIPVLLEFQSPY